MALIALTTTDDKDARIDPTAVVALLQADRGDACKVVLSAGVIIIVEGSVADTKTALGL
jgi:hypothetical protein